MKVEFFKHNIGNEEKETLLRVLDSIFLTTGDWVTELEQGLANYVDAKHAIGLTSCTAALHLSLQALGIGPGDEVITTPMTFVATSLAILHVGATPIWVDVESGTGNINVDLIEKAISDRTKAIIPVHLYGQMCDMRRIREVADRHRLVIIEDAAHALEGSRDGIRVGELSDAACFSFYATKSMTSGEGGAVSTNSEELASKIRVLRLHGINAEAADRYTRAYEHWDLLDIGWKYNMDNIHASLLCPQIHKIDANWQRRQEIFKLYTRAFADLPNVSMPTVLNGSKHGYHLFTVWVPTNQRDTLLERLQERGVGVAVNYRAIHLLSKFRELFGKQRGHFPEAERIGDSTISLPLYPNLKENEAEYVIESVRNSIAKL